MFAIETAGNKNSPTEAWYKYIDKGIISKNQLRAVIARSWERCLKYDLDPWMPPQRCKDFALLKAKRKENTRLISASFPILNYVFALLGENENVSLCDKNGFIVELICGLDYYPLTLGCNFSEEIAGTTPIGIVVAEGLPVITQKYEHYAACYHSYGGASVPIKDKNGILLGTLNAVNPNGSLSHYVLELLTQASLLITERFISGNDFVLEETSYFTAMLECLPTAGIVFDAKGQIIASNKILLNLLNVDHLELLKSCRIDGLISDKFKIALQDHFYDCSLVRKEIIDKGNGLETTLLIFDVNQSKKENSTLKNIDTAKDNVGEKIVGNSSSWVKLVNEIRKAAPYLTTVLIEGESGTGKELVAEAIHQASGRTGPFIAVNCGAIPKELLQSELFGYEAGAFTGARSNGFAGKFEIANKGTIFLDEIGEMPVDMQVSLLRFLQEKSITRIGSNKLINLDVRVIAATNRVLRDQVKSGEFREDLFYRLNVICIGVPPLRDRKADIPLLAEYFIAEICRQVDKDLLIVSEAAMQVFCRYDWPGNIRELRNVIERIVVFADTEIIGIEILPSHIVEYKPVAPKQLGNDMKNGARNVIIQTLEKYNGNITKSAKALSISRNTLYKKMKEMNIHVKVNLDC